MTPNEKKRFTEHVTGGTSRSPKYYALFKALCELDVFQLPEVKSKVRGVIAERELSNVFSQLQTAILKTLRFIDQKVDEESEIRRLLDEIQLLFNRQSYLLCQKHIRKAKKIAQTYHLSAYFLAVINWERRIQRRRQAKEASDQSTIDSEIKEEADALQRVIVEQRAASLYHLLFMGRSSGIPREELRQKFDSLMAQKPYHTFHTTIALNYIRRKFGDDDSFLIAQMNYEHWRAHPMQIRQHPDRYFGAVSIYIQEILQLDQPEAEVSALLEDIRQNIPPDVRSNLFPKIANFELFIHLNTAQPAGIRVAADRLARELQRGKSPHLSIEDLQSFQYNLGIAFVILDRPEQANKHFKAIWKYRKRSLSHYALSASIWELIIMLRMDSPDLENRYHSVLNYWKKVSNLPPLAIPTIHLIHRVSTRPRFRERPAEWQKFYQHHKSQFAEDANVPIYDVLRWVRSQAEGKDFRQTRAE